MSAEHRRETEHQQQRADDALDLLRAEQADRRAERARYVARIAQLEQGISLFLGAYLTATTMRPGAKRPEIEEWLVAERVRLAERQAEEDRRRLDALPDRTVSDWSEQ